MISVCVATYNGEKFIQQQLQSILAQLAPTDEIIISDDGSTDATLSIIEKMNDTRIKIFHHDKDLSLKKHHSPSFLFASYNFEYAIKQASGDIVMLSDQDDLWAPDRVKTLLPYMEKYDFVMCNFALIGPENEIIQEKVLPGDPAGKNLLYNLWKIPFRGCCMTLHRDSLLKSLPFPRLCVNHDIWIGCYLVHKGYKYKFIDIPLHYYRSHSSNVSPVVGKSPNGLWFKIEYRLRFLFQILFHRS